MDIRYASIRYEELTNEHVNLIRTTGVNSYDNSLLRSTEAYNAANPERCIVAWDHDIAQQIPEALAAIQRIIDEGIPIWNEEESRDHVKEPDSPFNRIGTWGDVQN